MLELQEFIERGTDSGQQCLQLTSLGGIGNHGLFRSRRFFVSTTSEICSDARRVSVTA